MKSNAYQIIYDQQSTRDADSGFAVLDNTKNLRPDWREYWPIRNHFKHNPFFQGYRAYLSTKFRRKTGLSAINVIDFLEGSYSDVVSFSPFIDQSAFYSNIFQHGELNHPGLMKVTKLFLNHLGIHIDLESQIGDHRYFIFSNFFFANQEFWSRWFFLAEQLFEVSETKDSELGVLLNSVTTYRTGESVQMKVFVMERLASLVLHLFPHFSVRSYPAFLLPSFGSKISKFTDEIAICNALKSQIIISDEPVYRTLFQVTRASALDKAKNL
jgi:hypothetical protein